MNSGVDYIEGGFPLSNPKDAAFFQEVKAAEASATRKHRRVRHDSPPRRQSRGRPGHASAARRARRRWSPSSAKPANSRRPKSSASRRKKICAMIADSVRFIRQAGRKVIYDAEHFFDAYRSQSRVCPARRSRPPQEAGATRPGALRHQRRHDARVGRRGRRRR